MAIHQGSSRARRLSTAAMAPVRVAATNGLRTTPAGAKGDNYVGAAEPQLRERMADIYSKVAQSFYRPNQAELDNLEAIESRFNNSKAEFKKIKDKHIPKLNAFINKDKIEPLALKTFQEFLLMP